MHTAQENVAMKAKESVSGNVEKKQKMMSGGVNTEEAEGLPVDPGLGCLCYRFAQKCQSTVTFSPTASPAAQPLLCSSHTVSTCTLIRINTQDTYTICIYYNRKPI